MEWKNIKIEDKDIIDRYIKGKFITSDLNFTNIFLWSISEKKQYKIENDILYIKAIYEGERYFFPPIPFKMTEEKIIEGIEKIPKQMKIMFIPEEYKSIANKYEYKEERDSFDYLYNQIDLAELKGRKYSSKKNKINKFKREYEYKYEKIDSSNIAEVIEFQKKWVNLKTDNIVKAENIGVLEILRNYSKFDLKGGLIKVKDNIVAYAFGESLNENIAVIHIEKALVEYQGSYQMINMLLAKEEFGDKLCINREDDFGSLGLREAKMSYCPVKLLKKYSLIRE